MRPFWRGLRPGRWQPGRAAVAMLLTAMAGVCPFTGLRPAGAQVVAGGAPALLTAAGPSAAARLPQLTGADIVVMQMLTPDEGVAVAAFPPPCPGTCAGQPPGPSAHLYLARTDDGGVTWRATGRISQLSATDTDLDMQFHTTSEGYVQGGGVGGDGPVVLLTLDGGQRWTALQTSGQATAIALAGDRLWTFATACPTTSSLLGCRTRMTLFPLGSTTPSAVHAVPTMGVPATDAPPGSSSGPRLLTRTGPTSGVVVEGGEGGPTSLIETVDSGRTWQAITDPCGSVAPSSMVTSPSGAWTLYCVLGGGMDGGTVRLYRSDDAGRRWALTAAANAEGHRVGSVGDSPASLSVSGNGKVLWLVDVADGLQVSTDGGRDWTPVALRTEGADSPITAMGATQAWVPAPFSGIYHTTDGRTWQLLRSTGPSPA